MTTKTHNGLKFSNRDIIANGTRRPIGWHCSDAYRHDVQAHARALGRQTDEQVRQAEEAYRAWSRNGRARTEDKLSKFVNGLANDLRDTVAEIEGGIKMTQDHYGRYMSLIGRLSGGEKDNARLLVSALIKAGANKNGVYSAFSHLIF